MRLAFYIQLPRGCREERCYGGLRLESADEESGYRVEVSQQVVFQKIDLLADFNPIARFLIRTFKAKPTITSFFSTASGELNIKGQPHALNCTAIHEFV